MSTESAKLVAQWGHLLPAATADERASVPTACVVMNEQARSLARLDAIEHHQLNELLGSDEQIIAAAGASILFSPLRYVVSIQPVCGPIGRVAAYMPKTAEPDPSGMPIVSLTIEPREIMAESRSIRVGHLSRETLTLAFDEASDAISREIIGDVMSIAEPAPEMPAGSALYDQMLRTSFVVHKATMRAPANFAVVGTDALKVLADDTARFAHPRGVLDRVARAAAGHNQLVRFVGVYGGRFNIIYDPVFPHDEILMGYVGPSLLDAGYVWGPWFFGVHSDEECGPRMQIRAGRQLYSAKHYARMRRV